jgi:hypothetical protein
MFRTMDRTSCDVLREKIPTAATTVAAWRYYQRTSTARKDSFTKLQWLHHHQPQHVSACWGVPSCGAAMMMTPSFVWLVTIESLAKTKTRSQRRNNWSTFLNADSVRAVLGLVEVRNYWVNTHIVFWIVMHSTSPIEWYVSHSDNYQTVMTNFTSYTNMTC